MPQNAALAIATRSFQVLPVLTGAQIRAARALLKWSANDLAGRCGISYAAIQRAEKVDDMPNMQTRNLAAIKSAFEGAGVIFLADGEDRPGGQGLRLSR